jgi:hypothetical protein
MNHKAKTSIGVECTRESILTVRFVTDEDGNLKIKQLEDFTDSKTELDFYQAMAAAVAGAK